MSHTTRMLHRLNRLASTVGVLGLLAMMALSVGNAAWRYAFNAPISGSMEIVTYWFMPVAILAGFFLATALGEIIEVTLVSDNLNPAARRTNTLVCTVLTAVVAAGFTWFTFQEAVHSWQIGRTAGVTGVTIWPVTFLVPLAFLGISILCVRPLVGRDRTEPAAEGKTTR